MTREESDSYPAAVYVFWGSKREWREKIGVRLRRAGTHEKGRYQIVGYYLHLPNYGQRRLIMKN